MMTHATQFFYRDWLERIFPRALQDFWEHAFPSILFQNTSTVCFAAPAEAGLILLISMNAWWLHAITGRVYFAAIPSSAYFWQLGARLLMSIIYLPILLARWRLHAMNWRRMFAATPLRAHNIEVHILERDDDTPLLIYWFTLIALTWRGFLIIMFISFDISAGHQHISALCRQHGAKMMPSFIGRRHSLCQRYPFRLLSW